MTTQMGIKCPQCGEEIYSNSVHDFVPCKCEYVFVDGGFDYLRFGVGSLAEITRVTREVDRQTLPRYFRYESSSN